MSEDRARAERQPKSAAGHLAGLAAMASAELHAAVAQGPPAASDLLSYLPVIRGANTRVEIAWRLAAGPRAAEGLPPEPPGCPCAKPDSGPVPDGPPGKQEAWRGLLESLARNTLPGISRSLADLDGWRPASGLG